MLDCQRFDRRAQLVRHAVRAVCVRSREHDSKLPTAVARHGISWSADRSGERFGHVLQAVVASLVAELIVVFLQVIEIDHDHRER